MIYSQKNKVNDNSMGSFLFGGMWTVEFINEKLTIDRYYFFYAESEYINLFFDKSIVQKLFNNKVIFSSFNTEETQTLILFLSSACYLS